MQQVKKTFDFNTDLDKDGLATSIFEKWTSWENERSSWQTRYQECLQYLYATDTEGIMSQSSDWQNTTHIPKLTQIRDLLITYYLEALFSLPNYVEWIGDTSEDSTFKKKAAIQSFCSSILKKSNFKRVIRKLIEDYVDAGNAFAMPIWDEEYRILEDGTIQTLFEGVKALRINPLDIVFDPSASDFKYTPKIIRSVVSLGELKKLAETSPDMKKAFDRAIKNRNNVLETISVGDNIRNNISTIAGFGNLTDYYSSDVAEILTFYGTLYDVNEDKLYSNKKIVIMDRCIKLTIDDMEDVNNCDYINHTSWRDIKDNLWGMSPLSNIVGMQYRIDFLENKRADIFNYISDPMWKTKGEVTMPEYLRPGGVINVDTDADVAMVTPDTTALNADMYIDRYMAWMDLMAGAPQEAIGFRTPGEKTAFEYSQLVNAATRVFNRQIRKFEEEIFEPLINNMLKLYLLKMAGQTVSIKIIDMKYDIEKFVKINIDDLKGQGKLIAVGSSNYADKNVMAQTLQQLSNTALFMDEAVRANYSPYVLGKIFSYVTNLDKYPGLFRKDARLYEVTHQAIQMEKGQQLLDEERAQAIQEARLSQEQQQQLVAEEQEDEIQSDLEELSNE